MFGDVDQRLKSGGSSSMFDHQEAINSGFDDQHSKLVEHKLHQANTVADVRSGQSSGNSMQRLSQTEERDKRHFNNLQYYNVCLPSV